MIAERENLIGEMVRAACVALDESATVDVRAEASERLRALIANAMQLGEDAST